MIIGEVGLELEGGNTSLPFLEPDHGLVIGVLDTFGLILRIDWGGQGWKLNRHILV